MDWAIDLLIVPALLEFRKPHQPSWTATKDFPISRETDCGDIVGTVSCQRDVFCSSYAQLVLWGWPCIPRTPGRAIVLVTSPGKEDLLLHGSHPLPSTKHWIILDSAHRKKKKSSPACSLILDQTLDHSYWQIWTGNFSALTVCIHQQPCFLPVPRPALKHLYDYVLGNLSQWKATLPHASNYDLMSASRFRPH